MDQAKGKQGKKKERKSTACNNKYMHIYLMLGHVSLPDF
jgi:hypothetical protein